MSKKDERIRQLTSDIIALVKDDDIQKTTIIKTRWLLNLGIIEQLEQKANGKIVK